MVPKKTGTGLSCLVAPSSYPAENNVLLFFYKFFTPKNNDVLSRDFKKQDKFLFYPFKFFVTIVYYNK
jgi:hypothetical protein